MADRPCMIIAAQNPFCCRVPHFMKQCRMLAGNAKGIHKTHALASGLGAGGTVGIDTRTRRCADPPKLHNT